MIHSSVYGRLGRDPEERQTRNGGTMAIASIAVNAGRPGQDDVTEWISVIAFGKAAEALLRHKKGDLLAAMGPMSKSRFTGRGGMERDSWSLTVESIVSARTVRPGGARRKSGQEQKPGQGHPAPEQEGTDLDDEIPF